MNELSIYGCNIPTLNTLRGKGANYGASGTPTERIKGSSTRVAITCVYVGSPVNNASDYALVGTLINGAFVPFCKVGPTDCSPVTVTVADIGNLITSPICTYVPSLTGGTVSIIEVEYVPEGFA